MVIFVIGKELLELSTEYTTVPCGDSSLSPTAYTHARVARAIPHGGVCADVVS